MLVDLWLLDTELGGAAAKQPWVIVQRQADDSANTRSFDHRILETLHRAASADVELARLSVSAPWFADGLTYSELSFLRAFTDVAATDTELARLVATLPWFADGSVNTRSLLVSSLEFLNGIASKDIELARKIAGLTWFADDVTQDEFEDLRLLKMFADSDIELARKISGTSWFADRGTFSSYVLQSLARLERAEADVLSQLTGQPWFADGLDEEEAALVVTLGWVASRSPELYADLLMTHHTQYRAVSLPMAGDVNIWIFQDTPFLPDEDLLTIIEDTARISEGFLGVPFPTTDIILLVADQEDRLGGWHAGTHMVLSRSSDGVRGVPHETAHYYFMNAPQWLTEGGSDFIETYFKDRTGIQSINDRRTEVSQRAQIQCFDLNEIENIRHYIYLWGWTTGFARGCPYYMGENFLLNVYETIGEEAVASALRELYPLVMARFRSGWEDDREEEEVIFDTFVKHVPAERMEGFLDLYHRLHGGPYAYPVIDPSDDHGDETTTATDVAVGEVVEGSLDYHFDFDYFKFRAEEGQRYRIRVNNEVLRSSSVLLYGSDGTTREQPVEKWTDEVDASCAAFQRPGYASHGVEMRWISPSTGDYYLAVHNFAGKSGRYTLEIAPVTTILDDHGDNPTTASDLAVGRVINGVVDYDFDLDFFLLQAVAGRKYRVRIETDVQPFFANVHLYTSDGIMPTQWLASDHKDALGGEGSSNSDWLAPSPGEYYFVAGGGCGSVGTYKLIVSEAESD